MHEALLGAAESIRRKLADATARENAARHALAAAAERRAELEAALRRAEEALQIAHDRT
jgi:hypothetical protein